MRFAVTYIVLVYALTAILPRDVQAYFWAQLIYLLTIESSVVLFSTKSMVYAGIYSVVTGLVLASMIGILKGKVKKFRNAIVSAYVGFLIALVSYAAMHKPVPYYKWVQLVEGFMLASCGVLLALEGKKEKLNLQLSILWLSLSAFRLCFILGLDENPVLWREMNQFVPALMVCSVFFCVGYSQRRATNR